MAPKKASARRKAASSEKRKVVRTTVEFKQELIAKYEEGVRVSDLVKEHGMLKSTISMILKNKEALISKQMPQILEEVEKLLLIFINKNS